jgi:crotonobetainyl-CoA:carnitine CoA-transferase CaiB-like acyl-CoA transferase
MRPLAGTLVSLASGDPAALFCARHLERLGARVCTSGGEQADIALVDDAGAARARVVCVFEVHVLDTGDFVGSEATAQAALGYGDYVSARGEPPARLGVDVGTAVAGICAAQAALAQLFAGTGRAVVKTSALRTLATLKSLLLAARSRPDEWSGTHVTSRDRAADSGYRVADGQVTIDFSPWGQASWEAFVARLGLSDAEVARLRPRWYETVGWGDDVDAARPVYESKLGALPAAVAQELVRECGGSSVPFLRLDECLAHPQSYAVELRDRAVDGLPWRMRAVGESAARAPEGDAGAPLAGVRVLDFGVGGVAPFAATLLGWLGADVVKVEAPNEFILTVRPNVGGVSSTYFAINQSKRSVELNLKSAGEVEVARRLLSEADVLLENFRPGALDGLGLGFDDVAALNPSIVYCSATGFGWDGPLARQPCTDPHMQAFSGFAWANADGVLPRRIRYYGFVDLVTSCVIAEAICAALLARKRAGGAVRVETSMLHAVVAVQAAVARAPVDEIVPARDGAVGIACRSDGERAVLAEALGCADAPPGGRALEAVAAAPGAAWVARLARRGVPCARAVSDDDVLARADLRRWGLLTDLELPHAPPITSGGPPWDLGSPPPRGRAPMPGADTAELRARPDRVWAATG